MKTRGLALAAASTLITTLFSVAPAQADDDGWRHGWCREDEGLSVVVDYGPEGQDDYSDLELPVEGWDIRCLIGGEITRDDDYTRLDALEKVGFEVEGSGYVTGINGVAEGASSAFWMFSGADIASGGAWSQDLWDIAKTGVNTNIALGVRYSSDWNDFVPRPTPVYGAPNVPSAPLAPEVSVNSTTANISWSTPAGNGAEVTSYIVTLTPTAGGAPVTRVVEGATTATFDDLAGGEWTATVVATNATGDSVASASTAFTVIAPAGATSLSASPAVTTWGQKVSTVVTVTDGARGTVRGTVRGTLAGRTATATVTNGRATLSWPAKVQRPGTTRIALTFTSADTAKHLNSTGSVTSTVSKTIASVKVTAAKKKVKRSKKVALTIRVTGNAGDKATGKVKVAFRGKTQTVSLKSGKAVVRVTATKKLGAARATVTYLGDFLHTQRKATSAKIRTVR